VTSGGVTKGRVYGAPHMTKSIGNTSSSSHSYSVESSNPSSSYRALQKEIKKKDDFIFEMKRQMDSMKEYLMNNLGCHGGTSNIDQGMPTPMAPSMPLTYDSLDNDTYRSHIFTNLSTYTSTIIY
jgi:hypothetical protein